MVVAEKNETRDWCVVENKGQKIFGVLHTPISEEREVPLVVIMHGFASCKHGTNRSHVHLAEQLSNQGIATLRFDFRGSGDSEGSLSEISIEDMVSDAKAMLAYIEEVEGIDPGRIGVFGSSLGGAIAVLSSVEHGNVKAIALWAPVASGELWYRDFIAQNPELIKEDPKKVLSSYRGIRLHPTFQEQFARMTAGKKMAELDIPFLHMHAENDTTVSFLHQQVYKLHCEGRIQPARFLSYPDAAHHMGNMKVCPEIIQESVTWFKEYL
ncbi:MAG: alpha/beta hydrolase [Chlamydiales bacterium]